MAKTEMVCPFSNKVCEECALYRGRHYFLCFCERYRGHLSKPGRTNKANLPFLPGARPNPKFEIPLKIPTRAIDPFAIDPESRQKKA
ncbi:hypothetical protein ACFLTN_03045 [Chloroflexota bacterium]